MAKKKSKKKTDNIVEEQRIDNKSVEDADTFSGESDVLSDESKTKLTEKEDKAVKNNNKKKKTTSKTNKKPKNKNDNADAESNDQETKEVEETSVAIADNALNEEPKTIEEDNKPESNDDSALQADKKKKNIVPLIAAGIILATFVFLLVLLPLIRQNDAIEKIGNGRNEEAIIELDGLVPLFRINELKEEAFDNIAYEIAEEVQNSHIKFSSDVFKIGPITDRSINLYDEFEEISFIVNYANEECDAFVECYAEKEYDGSEWALTRCDILSTRYEVKKNCDQSIPDEIVFSEFPKAAFVEKGEQNQLYQSFIYEYKDIDPEDPFYYDINRLNALCTYNPSKKEWTVSEITSSVIDTEEIPLKEYITSAFTIKLPEAWVMRIYESSWANDYNGEHNEQYNYSYEWFAREEDTSGFQTKDGTPGIFSIGINAGTNNSYSSNNNKGQTINADSLGKGKLTEYDSYNGRRSVSASFSPKFKGFVSSFFVSSEYVDADRMISIVNGIKYKTTTYTCEVLVNKLNIRKWASVSSERVGSTSKGQKHKATEVQDGYDGYRWYRIGEEQWIADLNGEYLKITYK